MALRGIDMAEWAVCVDAEPPALAKFDPSGKRPVVYVALSTDTAANVGAKGQSGPERSAKLAKALASVVGAGKPLLLSLNPSTLPTFGESDPMVSFLPGFGLTADTGHPLLKERFTADGRHVDAFQSLVGKSAEHPIARRSPDFPLASSGPSRSSPRQGRSRAPRKKPSSDAHSTPLYLVEDKAVWAESQWLGYWQVRLQEHDAVRTSRRGMLETPREVRGPWPPPATRPLTVSGIAAPSPRRLQHVVHGPGRSRARPGRWPPAFTNPGNSELFEASVYWLAGQDEMIAASATARAVPLIRPLSGGTVLALRWLAIAGLPGGVLLVGMVWRLLRG
jgi:hypothetical protein